MARSVADQRLANLKGELRLMAAFYPRHGITPSNAVAVKADAHLGHP